MFTSKFEKEYFFYTFNKSGDSEAEKALLEVIILQKELFDSGQSITSEPWYLI